MDRVADVERRAPDPDVGSRRRAHRWLELGVLLAILAGAVGVAALWSRTHPQAPEAPRRGSGLTRPATATPAPDFTLPDLAGQPVRLREFRGRVVLLNFWATWCPPCLRELPAIEALSREHGEDGLVVLAVDYQESPERVSAFVRERGLGLRVLLDRDGAVTQRYRVTGLPASVLVDREGMVAGSALGYRDWHDREIRAFLGELLAARR